MRRSPAFRTAQNGSAGFGIGIRLPCPRQPKHPASNRVRRVGFAASALLFFKIKEPRAKHFSCRAMPGLPQNGAIHGPRELSPQTAKIRSQDERNAVLGRALQGEAEPRETGAAIAREPPSDGMGIGNGPQGAARKFRKNATGRPDGTIRVTDSPLRQASVAGRTHDALRFQSGLSTVRPLDKP
jgi:hypothetical protein